MHASRSMLASAWLILGTVAAIPAPSQVARAPADPTDLWVTVDKSGRPKTVTPIQTTISGTPTVISGAPNDVTASVITRTNLGEVSTSTGEPPLPTATATKGAGAFPVCRNKDGPNAPFCLPTEGSSLYPGTTYFITWDPTFFKSNTSIKITGSSFNTTTGEILDQAFPPTKIEAGWSYYAWTVDSSILKAKSVSAVNISLTLTALQAGEGLMKPFPGPRLLVTERPTYHKPPSKPPSKAALYIGLPTVLGFVVLLLIGTCVWNRRSRRIGVGSVMGRGRGGYGVGKSRRQRMFGRGNKDRAIRLVDQDVDHAAAAADGPGADGFRGRAASNQYRDDDAPGHEEDGRTGGGAGGWRQEVPGRHDDDFDFGMPRRDSDALGSLAGTPTEDRRMDLGRGDGGNAFRDELSRQDKERL